VIQWEVHPARLGGQTDNSKTDMLTVRILIEHALERGPRPPHRGKGRGNTVRRTRPTLAIESEDLEQAHG